MNRRLSLLRTTLLRTARALSVSRGPGVAALSCVLLLAGCNSSTVGGAKRQAPVFRDLDDTSIQRELEIVRADLEGGDPVTAFEVLRPLWRVPNLAPSARSEAELLLEKSASGVAAITSDPGKLKALYNADLPSRVRVTFGIAAARRYYEHGRRLDAFRMIEKLDETFPTHHMRPEAGTILSEAGLSLAHDKSVTLFFFATRKKAPQVLEYLVLNYPMAPRADEAYLAMADLYEEDREWQLAIDRHSELLTYHPESPLAVSSEAAIPRLRLIQVRRHQYDRSQFELAESELESWLTRHPGNALESQVREDLREARTELAKSDLGIAKFYRTIKRWFGARQHAERALIEARTAEDEDLIAQVEAFQRTLPPDPDRVPQQPAPAAPVAEPASPAETAP